VNSVSHLEEKHPLAIRWFHWISFPLLFLMMWSGLLIYWANDVYRVGWEQTTLLRFFPDWFYQALHIPQRLAEGMALHFFFMWLFVANGMAYVSYLAFSGEWRNLLPDRKALRDALLVTLHDLHLRSELPPQGLYNGAQRIAYTGVIVMAIGSVITGLAIYKPAQLSWLTGLLGGYPMARWVHFWLMIGFFSFFLVHIAQVIRAGWDNFRSMVAGFSLVKTYYSPVPSEEARFEHHK
jgi:thiosulfate reductase cytochrome b subunit